MSRYIKLYPLIAVLAYSFMGTAMAKSPGLPEESAIKAILGEAEGESYAGKVALAYALKNRGKLTGVYGHKAIILRSGAYFRGDRRLNEKVVKEAQKALQWANSHPFDDPTCGATHWENVKAFGVPYWAKDMLETYRLGNHVFYLQIERA